METRNQSLPATTATSVGLPLILFAVLAGGACERRNITRDDTRATIERDLHAAVQAHATAVLDEAVFSLSRALPPMTAPPEPESDLEGDLSHGAMIPYGTGDETEDAPPTKTDATSGRPKAGGAKGKSTGTVGIDPDDAHPASPPRSASEAAEEQDRDRARVPGEASDTPVAPSEARPGQTTPEPVSPTAPAETRSPRGPRP